MKGNGYPLTAKTSRVRFFLCVCGIGRRCACARQDVRFNRPDLLRRENLRERWHSLRCTGSAEHDGLKLLMHGLAGIPQIGQRPGDSVGSVTTRTLAIKKKFAFMNQLRG